jgi:hypothetical protein
MSNNISRRQNIGSVERMLSFSKKPVANNERNVTLTETQQNATATSELKKERDSDEQGKKAKSSHRNVTLCPSDENLAPFDPSPADSQDRKKAETTMAQQTSNSDSLKDDAWSNQTSTLSSDRERRETEKVLQAPGSRMGIKNVGRFLSMTKKPQITNVPTRSATEDANTSAERSNSKTRDRDRLDPSASGLKKDAPRMGIKTTGRLLSFSRKPAKPTATALTNATALPEPTPVVSPGAQSNVMAQARSPRLDGRASRFFFSEINSEAIKKCGALSNDSHIRVPVLVMAEYSGPVSKTKWFIDAFTLPHNAVRRECIDLYDILMALARCRGNLDITRDDMRDFHSWWIVAYRFFRTYFEMERNVLFPWVDGAGSKDWELQMALNKMRSMKDGLQEQLEAINDSWKHLESKAPGELFGLVFKGVDSFCPRLMNYFADQELLLPAIVKGVYTIEDRLSMDKDMLEAFMDEPLSRKNKDLAHHNLVLLIRWIPNPRQLRAWISKNLNSTGRTACSKWQAMYEADHARIVKMFRNRSRMNAMAAIANPSV